MERAAPLPFRRVHDRKQKMDAIGTARSHCEVNKAKDQLLYRANAFPRSTWHTDSRRVTAGDIEHSTVVGWFFVLRGYFRGVSILIVGDIVVAPGALVGPSGDI